MDIRDRGAKKWVSMMLPEHVAALREWERRVKTEEPRPEPADHRLDEMDGLLRVGANVTVWYYDEVRKKTESVTGEIRDMDRQGRRLVVGDVTLAIGDVIEIMAA